MNGKRPLRALFPVVAREFLAPLQGLPKGDSPFQGVALAFFLERFQREEQPMGLPVIPWAPAPVSKRGAHAARTQKPDEPL
jgi:hypothetical protein